MQIDSLDTFTWHVHEGQDAVTIVQQGRGTPA